MLGRRARADAGRSGIRDQFRLRRFDGAWIDIEIATVNLLDDPAMGGILVTATAGRVPRRPPRRRGSRPSCAR